MLKVFYETKEDSSYYQNKEIQYDITVNEVTGSEPVSVSDAKEWSLIDTSADDTVIGFMITSVRQALEQMISRDIVARNRTYYIEYYDQANIVLPFTPLSDIISITAGQDATALTLNSDYYIRGVKDKVIELVTYPKEYVTINYTTQGITNQNVKDAIKATFEYLYDSRGLVSLDNFKGFEIPQTAKMLIQDQKKMFI